MNFFNKIALVGAVSVVTVLPVMKTLSAMVKYYGPMLMGIFIVLNLFSSMQLSSAQSSRFFRISGPSATILTSFRPDGSMVWSNTLAGTNYTIQTLTTLPGGTNWVDYVQLATTNRISTNQLVAFYPPAGMAFIPAGQFTMGDVLDGDLNALPTNVMVSAFFMDTNLVSYGRWQSVYNWATNHGYDFVHTGSGKATNHPVQAVDWFDVVKWCNARSQLEGLTPAYYVDANFTRVYKMGETNLGNTNVNWSANGYRLPTEAEWEKAARGGLIGKRFPWGNTISKSQANYSKGDTSYSYDLGPQDILTTFPKTAPVGSYAPNGYGLFDMTGNTFEWCWDWYFATYAGGIDPHGPTETSPLHIRVLRGGSGGNDANQARCAYRYWVSIGPTDYANYFGFRCVRSR